MPGWRSREPTSRSRVDLRAAELLLGIRVTVPVRAAFAIAIDLRPHRTLRSDSELTPRKGRNSDLSDGVSILRARGRS
jgi:hypothetical protein